jgi:hypothetical protein
MIQQSFYMQNILCSSQFQFKLTVTFTNNTEIQVNRSLNITVYSEKFEPNAHILENHFLPTQILSSRLSLYH